MDLDYSPSQRRMPIWSRKELAWIGIGVVALWLFLVFVGQFSMLGVTLGMVKIGVGFVFWTFLIYHFPQWSLMLLYGIIIYHFPQWSLMLLYGIILCTAIGILTVPGGWQFLGVAVIYGWLINSGQHKKIKALSGQTLLVVNLAVAAIIALLSGY
ncbi:MAG: hypothetical protein EOP04_26390, partial [Proteobacteria bacterium]